MSATDPGAWARIQDILVDALELEGSERQAFLDRECGNDAGLRREVLSLLDAAEGADRYFADLADRAGITSDVEGTPPPSSPDLEGRVVGAYRLGALLGRGGMGAVYLAERADGHFEQTVALKILPLGAATPEAHRRFLEERRILARLEHPNIARLYDGGVTEDGTPYFVMERVDGAPITDYCRNRQLGVDDRIRLFLAVCDAVAFAHGKLVVHRDLKPNNILVTADGTVKLLDFGIARLVEPGMSDGTATALGGRLMTPRYASPEQLKGEPVTTSSDVYALGVLLYELLTGISPYDLSGDSGSLVQAVCSQTVTVPSTRIFKWARGTVDGTPEVREVVAAAESMGSSVRALSRSLRGDLDNILLMALRKEPARRYSSVEALAEDLRRHMEGFPVKARREGMTYVTGRFLQRNAVTVASVASVLVLLSVLLFLSARLAVTTREQAVEIARERDRAAEIANFMRELFEVANPGMAQGETVTARELLDAGVHKIREDHPDEPALQAEMMTVLGTVYHHLGLDESARDLLREAASLHAGLPEVHEEEKAKTLLELGKVLRDTEDRVEAERVLREARDRLAGALGSDHREVASATFELAETLHRNGDLREAEAEFRKAISSFRSLSMDRDAAYAHALFLVAEYMQVRGDSEAESLYRDALQILRVRRADDHPDLPRILAGLAWSKSRQEKRDSATILLREAIATGLRVYGESEGPNSPSLAQIYVTAGMHLGKHGDPVEAETILREADRIFGAIAGAPPELRGRARLALADFLRDQGRNAEALAQYREAGAGLRSALGPGSLMEENVRVHEAELLVDMGRGREAEPLLIQALDRYSMTFSPESAQVVRIRQLLARARGEAAPL